MTTRTVDLLDSAIGTVKSARELLRHDTEALASDLSAVLATVRELVWTLDTFTASLTDTYARQHGLGHDNGHDPNLTVAVIVERLARCCRCFDQVDGLLGDAHNHAAHLHN